MASKYLDYNGLSHFWDKLKEKFATKAQAISNITRSGTTFTATRADGTTFTFTQQDNTVAKTTTTPKMDGTATIGTETKYAAGDHVHPSDTSRVPTTRTVNGHALSSDINITNLDLGQMYGTCSTAIAYTDKTVSMSGYLLTTGGIVSIKFTNGVGAASTLNINGEGSKPIYCNGSAILNSIILPGDTATFIYDGTNYNLLNVIGDKSPINITTGSTTASEQFTIRTADGQLYQTYNTSKIGNLLSDKLDSGDIGVANGVAPLNSNSKIDAIYLPSYVDDVIEAYAVGSTPLADDWLSLTASGSALAPETGKIYILMVTSGDYSANSQFRWSGSTYVQLYDGGISAITNSEIDTIVAS